MFGTMGISELIIILAIVLIIFGAGRLPQIGEGVGKALKGFKKEVHDAPPPVETQSQQETPPARPEHPQPIASAPIQTPRASSTVATAVKPNIPYTPGPEMTPGTTASLLYTTGPQSPHLSKTAPDRAPHAAETPAQHVVTMEERAAAPAPIARGQYPPLPPGTQTKPSGKRPSAIVNKDAVARIQAQQAALKAKAAPAGVSPEDMQSLGEGMGDVLRTFRQAATDVRNSIAPEMRTLQAEMDMAHKELQQSLDAAAEPAAVQEDPPKPT
ncbi:MAG: twin-arginine translocase TatA/TatE family subunit [Nitrospira sp.]|nr:twin-arginine translocase TatA/TatE family subunit [Nitrospira sp.]